MGKRLFNSIMPGVSVLVISGALMIVMIGCGRTTSIETQTDSTQSAEPTGTFSPTAIAESISGSTTQTNVLSAESLEALKPKLFELAGMTGELDVDGYLAFKICLEDDYGHSFHFSGLPDDYPIPFIAITANTMYLFAADEACSDVILVQKLNGLSVNPIKTYITQDTDIICIISQAPWQEATVSIAYKWDGRNFIQTAVENSDETKDYYGRMKQYVAEENIEALRKEYTSDSTPPYCVSYQDYFELPAMVLRLADKMVLAAYRDKAAAIETMEYGLQCYENVWSWSTDGNWKEGLKSITMEQIQGSNDFNRDLRLSADEFVRVMKDYIDLLYDVGQDTDLEALLLRITELNQSMNQAYAERLDRHGDLFNIADFGLENVSAGNFYWSAEGEAVIFIGNKRNQAGEWTSGVYILNPFSRKMETIMEGMTGSPFMPEPGWSEDGNTVVFSLYNLSEKEQPIYLYHVDSKTVKKLPALGWYPALSPDMKKVAFSKADGSIVIYTVSDGSVTNLPKNIKGFNPIWLSDNRRILLFKSTGKNPNGLEGGELHDICVVDTRTPNSVEPLGYEKVYRSMEWIIQDHLTAIYSGWDDGYYFELLNLDTGKLVELGEGGQYSYQRGEKSYIIKNGDGSFEVLDTDLKVTRDLFPAKGNANNRFLKFDSNDMVVYLSEDPTTGKAAVMLSDREKKTNKQMTEYDDYVIPIVTRDGERVILFNGNEKSFILIHTYDIAHRIQFTPDVMVTHEEGIKLIMNSLATPVGNDIEINYTGMEKPSFQFFYQYTVGRKTDSGGDAALNLLVNVQTGEIIDADFKSGDYPILPVSAELRGQVAELMKQSPEYKISPELSMMFIMEDFRFSKTLKVEAFRDEGMKDGLMLQLQLEEDNGLWKLAEEGIIPLDGTQQVTSDEKRGNPNKILIINHNDNLNHPIDSKSDTINTGNLDAAISMNRLYPVESGLQYDFNGDNQPDALTYRIISHSNTQHIQSCQELELQLGDGYIYYQLFRDPYGEYMSGISATGICDIDKSDNYIEFYITTETNNGVYWNTTIYRLNENNEIVKLAFLGSSILGVSGDGKVYYWGGNLVERAPFNPDYVVSYYDINLGDFVSTDQIIGKTFTDIRAIIYENREDVPTGAPVEASLEFPGAIRFIKENEPVTILEVGGDTAKIQTEDGLVGWIGGFHMVFD